MKASDLKLWKASAPIRKTIGDYKAVWLYVASIDLDELAKRNPEDYLDVVSSWQRALMNQEYYRFDGDDGLLHIACSQISGGQPIWFEFECEVAKDDLPYIRIVNVDVGKLTSGVWLSVKKMGRK